MADGDAQVSVEVLRLDRVQAGRLVALAMVAVEIDGLQVVLQGVRAVRNRDGTLTIGAPVFRGPDGRWLPAVILPEVVEGAISELVGKELRGDDRD